MALPDFTMRQLLEAGAHFGHQTHRWNPKMAPYIFGARNNIHIIDLAQTVPLLHQALKQFRDTVARGGRVLFVGTKRQASDIDRRCRQAFGPILHQFALARRHADQLEDDLQFDLAPAQARRDAGRRGPGPHQEGAPATSTASARSSTRRSAASRTWAAMPDLMFVIDTNKERSPSWRPSVSASRSSPSSTPTAIRTASTSRSRAMTTPARAIALYCDLIARAAIDGIARQPGRARRRCRRRRRRRRPRNCRQGQGARGGSACRGSGRSGGRDAV